MLHVGIRRVKDPKGKSVVYLLQEELLLEPMFEVPGSAVTAVHITEDVVKGIKAPHYEYCDSNNNNKNQPVILQTQSNDRIEQPEESSVQL